ncbi:DUF6069 family protein [Promicromonospora sukumoe]|uniref:DUF6069 family protein n=1 Tax=Promicromonospora sukumoe TaxID=88382 RepID=UPI00036405CC|nr:DUF6069 family protein [Promicromonospora sukumoe]
MAENLVTRSPWPAWAVPLAAAVAAVAVWLVGAALGVDPQAQAGATTQPVTVVAAAVAALVAGFAGWGVRAIVARLTKGGGEVAWLVLCGVALLVSLTGAASGTTPAAVALLMTEHLVVGVIVALGLRRARPSRASSRAASSRAA